MTTKIPDSMLENPGGGSGSIAVSVAYSTTIPLDTIGAGKIMPATTLAAASVFGFSGVIAGGNCQFTLIGDGNSAHAPNFSAFQSGDGYHYSSALGSENNYAVEYLNGKAVIYGSLVGDTGGSIPIGYGTVIPLDVPGRGKIMDEVILSANSVFTVGTAVNQGQCDFTLIGDGTHIPDLSAFPVTNGYVYVNTVNARNCYGAIRQSSSNILFGIRGEDASGPDTSKPTLLSAVIENAAPTLVVQTYSESLSGTLSAAGTFAVSGKTILSRAAGGTPNIIILTLSAPVAGGEILGTSYTKSGTNDLQDAAGNKTDNYSASPVTNNVAGTAAMTVTLLGSFPAENLDTQGYSDWYYFRTASNEAQDKSMLGGSGIGVPIYTGSMARGSGAVGGGNFSFNGTEQDGVVSASTDDNGNVRLTAFADGVGTWLFDGTTSQYTVKCLIGIYENTVNAPDLVFDLDDASVSAVVKNPAPGGGGSGITFYAYQVQYSCVSSSVKLRMKIKMYDTPSTAGVFPKILTLKHS